MYNAISANKRNSWILIFVFAVFVTAVGYGFGFVYSEGNPDGAIGFAGIFGIVAMVYAGFSYFAAGKMTLAMTGARKIEKRDHFRLFTVVENLSIAAGVPMPEVYLIADPAPNAFATGRDPRHAAVAITSGLLEKLDKAELEGVMAHELSHVKNYDIRIQCLVVALVGLIVFMSDIFLRSLFYGNQRRRDRNGIFILIGLALAILSPLFAKLMQLALSRQREYLADASGAMLTRYPEGLARALEKIHADHHPMIRASKATAHLFIASPLRNERGMKWLNGLFSTHPPAAERIARLRGMA